ncbi:hypothetical protein VTO42DRAFT_7283 [Malbranchea cinnamomea]
MLNMLFRSSTKRNRDEIGEEKVGRLRKKPRPLSSQNSAAPHNNSYLAQLDYQAATNPSLSVPTPAESSEEDGAVRSQGTKQHRSTPLTNKNWLDTMRVEKCSEMDLDLEMTDSQPESANASTLYSPSLCSANLNVLAPFPIPSQLINDSLTMDGGHGTMQDSTRFTPNSYMSSLMRKSGSQNIPTSFNFDSRVALGNNKDPWSCQGPPSPISEDENTLSNSFVFPSSLNFPSTNAQAPHQGCFARSDGSMGYNAPSGHQHAENNTRNTTFRSANRPKLGIAMGYRADCDKCQRRVPGHYSHIVRS